MTVLSLVITEQQADNLQVQQQERELAIDIVRKLRAEARDEIDRLLAFLDQSDEYVMTEREPDGDEDEEGDPGEDGADDEPSLGSHEAREGGVVSYLHHYVSDGCEMLADCETEHDGREPDYA